jgi:hypothetical protein
MCCEPTQPQLTITHSFHCLQGGEVLTIPHSCHTSITSTSGYISKRQKGKQICKTSGWVDRCARRTPIVDRFQPGRVWVSNPGHLHRSRPPAHHAEPIICRVASQLHQDVHPVLPNETCHSVIAQVYYSPPRTACSLGVGS